MEHFLYEPFMRWDLTIKLQIYHLYKVQYYFQMA
jgi:hypothetical protein